VSRGGGFTIAGNRNRSRIFALSALLVWSAGDARASRTMAAHAVLLGPSSFETAGILRQVLRSLPPQDEELVFNQSKSLCQGAS
jgi:hypothetical protein